MEEHVADPLSQGQIEEHKEAERNIAVSPIMKYSKKYTKAYPSQGQRPGRQCLCPYSRTCSRRSYPSSRGTFEPGRLHPRRSGGSQARSQPLVSS
jgi:hypothetical protein